MSLADDLLAQAYHLLHKDGDTPIEASFRRAISTAYYALFHLLTDDAVGNWGIARQRSVLARKFKHRMMKKICEQEIKDFYIAKQPPQGLRLKDVAQTFKELQQKREAADYDTSNNFSWTRVNVVVWFDKVSVAFENWRAIRAEEDAQDFLLSLFMPDWRKERDDYEQTTKES